MRITWFGASTFRIYLGGRIVVVDPEAAPADVDRHELVAAADHVVALGRGDLPALDPAAWRHRRPRRAIDMPAQDIFDLRALPGGGLFIDEPEEGPLIATPAGATTWERFADDAAVTVFGEAAVAAADIRALMAMARPRLVAIAATDVSGDQFRALADIGGGSTLLVLEPGLAVEA